MTVAANTAPVSRSVLDAAIDWRLRLDAALDEWLARDEAHARVWQQLQQIDSRIGGIGTQGRKALLHAGKPRRALGGALVLLLGVAALLALADRQWPLRHATADHVTATGEQRSLQLEDGTRIQLDARSALDVAFDAQRRRVVLRSGQLWVETAHGDARPFVVATAEGELRALGTRFVVQRPGDGLTRLVVLEAAVEATARDGERRVLRAGDSVLLAAGGLTPTRPADPGAAAWTHGMLAVENAPLAEVIAALSRHTTARLSVDPRVASLRVTGTFPLRDPELALASLTASLPLRERRTTDWWVRLEPAGD